MLTTMVYVADTDEQAEREGQPYMERFFSWFHRVPPKYMTPPGYVTRANFERLAFTAALADSQQADLGADARDRPHRDRVPGHRCADAGGLGARGRQQPDHAEHGPRGHARGADRQEPAVVRDGGDPAYPRAPRGGRRREAAGTACRASEMRGVEIALREAGDGPPLLFLHGAGTATGFERLLPLAEHFRLLVPHHPGFGESEDDPEMTGVHDLERHYLDLLDLLEIDELALVGHSMGGWLAATLAISQGSRVRSLVLAAPWGLRVPEHPTVDMFSDPRRRAAALPDRRHVRVRRKGAGCRRRPTFLADRYREATSAARFALGAHRTTRRCPAGSTA